MTQLPGLAINACLFKFYAPTGEGQLMAMQGGYYLQTRFHVLPRYNQLPIQDIKRYYVIYKTTMRY